MSAVNSGCSLLPPSRGCLAKVPPTEWLRTAVTYSLTLWGLRVRARVPAGSRPFPHVWSLPVALGHLFSRSCVTRVSPLQSHGGRPSGFLRPHATFSSVRTPVLTWSFPLLRKTPVIILD